MQNVTILLLRITHLPRFLIAAYCRGTCTPTYLFDDFKKLLWRRIFVSVFRLLVVLVCRLQFPNLLMLNKSNVVALFFT